MLVAARLLVAFAYFIHHGLELLLIPFKVLCLLDFVCRYWQRHFFLIVSSTVGAYPAVHKLVELSLVRGLRWRAGLTNGLLRPLRRQRSIIESTTQLFARLVLLWALDSLHFEDIKMLRKPVDDFHFAGWRWRVL
jgi:hypothetical protein